MSDTPRTDATATHLVTSFIEGFERSSLDKSFDHARDLERQLIEARRLLQNIANKEHGRHGGVRIRIGEQDEIRAFLATLPTA